METKRNTDERMRFWKWLRMKPPCADNHMGITFFFFPVWLCVCVSRIERVCLHMCISTQQGAHMWKYLPGGGCLFPICQTAYRKYCEHIQTYTWLVMVNLEVTQCTMFRWKQCLAVYYLWEFARPVFSFCCIILFIYAWAPRHKQGVYKTNKSVDLRSINQLSMLPKTVQRSVWMNTSLSSPQLQESQQTEYQLDILLSHTLSEWESLHPQHTRNEQYFTIAYLTTVSIQWYYSTY